MGFSFLAFISAINDFISSKVGKFQIKDSKFQFNLLEFGIWFLNLNFGRRKFKALQQLNFPKYQFRFKNSENKISIFDVIRKRFFILQPEEWVRQHCVHYLMEEKKYPKSLINVEKELTVNNLRKRYDIVIYNTDGSIHLIVECKAPHIDINQHTFDQIARYNLTLNATFLMVTNGINHYYCQMDFDNECFNFLKDIPDFDI